MFSKIDRYLKVIFPLVLLGFSAHAAALCPDCARAWLSVSNSLDQVDSDLVVAQSQSSSSHTLLNIAQNEINVAQSLNQDVNVNVYLAQSQQYLDNLSLRLSQLDTTLSSARQRVAYASGLLASFECHCQSSTNCCPCVEILNGISDTVTMIWEEVHYNISPMMTYLNEWLDQFKLDYDSDIEWLKERLDRFDDDYYSDLQQFHLSVYNRVKNFDSMFDPESLFSVKFPGSTPSYNIGNELLALSSIAGTSTMSALASYDAAMTLRFIASNSTARTYGELQFISNYLDTVQRKFYALFDKITLPGAANVDPFHTATIYRTVTNSWKRITDPNRSYDAKSSAFMAFHKQETNWFSRIEWYLMGIAGAFDQPNETGLEDLTQETAMRDYFSTLTNSLDLSQLSSYSNTVSDLIERFKYTVQLLVFNKSSEDIGITIIPSFSFGGIFFETVILPYSTFQPIIDFVRSAFRVVWYSIFLFFGFVLLSRVVRLFIMTVGHVVLVVKTLL